MTRHWFNLEENACIFVKMCISWYTAFFISSHSIQTLLCSDNSHNKYKKIQNNNNNNNKNV